MFTLNDGSQVPAIGFGTYQLRGEEGTAAIASALGVGYRLLDTAASYGNEREVGEALRHSGIRRDEVWITTKIKGRDHERALALASIERSLETLGVDQVDLVLVHWPNPSRGRYVEAFEALVEAKDRGLTRAVGVSNFTEQHLDEVITATGITPVVNQIEVHPLFPQEQMAAANAARQVLTQSWSPLGKRQAQYDSPAVTGPARRLGLPRRRSSSPGTWPADSCRSPSPPPPPARSKTSPPTASPSTRPRSTRSARSVVPTGASSAATPRPTRSSDPWHHAPRAP
ncbi:aldo/keto reductase [Ornithinimicrobium panacihumi]|uniref:aldo/keto reductase n=1 Tax=Ornithinimicrobium panacihumi TaxID=2008449 RepID=UPI003F8B6BF7